MVLLNSQTVNKSIFVFSDTADAIGAQAAWDESQVITGEDPSQVIDVDDDLARELAFYNQVRHKPIWAHCPSDTVTEAVLLPEEQFIESVQGVQEHLRLVISGEHSFRVRCVINMLAWERN